MRQPKSGLEGPSIRAYQVGEVYDIPPSVAQYLVIEGFAIVEMRNPDTRTADATDRRRKPR